VHLGDAKSLSDRCSCDGMVEVLELVVPLNAQVVVAIVLESLVDRSEVLQATHRSNELMGRFNYIHVVQADSERIPTLLDLRVGVCGTVIVRIDISHDGDGDLRLSEDELVLENYLKVGVVVVIEFVVSRCANTS